MTILVVEDNRALASNIIEYMEAHGFECDYADNGNLGFQLANEQLFDLIILDLMLPGMDGMNICKQLRENGNCTPVLMLTARGSLQDKLEGFDAGADDYLVKPFDLPELMARAQVLIRRSVKTSVKLSVSDVVMDKELHQVSRAGKPIELSNAGWLILEALLKASPKVVTRQEVENIIWPDELPDSDVLKSHIYKLRQLIDKPYEKPLIHTVRGVGLVLKDMDSEP